MFWRKAMTDRAGKIDPLRKIATEAFCSAYAGGLKAQLDGSRVFFGDCAVGAAHLLGVFAGGEMDSAVLEMAWEGERIVAQTDKAAVATGERIQTHSLYILSRKGGVKSDPGTSVTSAHCPNCGAPMTSDTSAACAFCGTVLNDGTRGWVLSSITSASSDEGRRWIARINSPSVLAAGNIAAISRKGLLAWAVKVTAADGTIDPREKELLQSLAAKCAVESARLDQMIEMALAGGLDVPDPPDRATAQIWLNAMAAAALSDGQVQPAEVQILLRAAQRFGFSPADVDLILKQQYAQHLAAARTELRAQRGRQN